MMDPTMPDPGGYLDYYYAQADQAAQEMGVDPAYAMDLATEAVATKVASYCMFNEVDRIFAEREAAEWMPSPGEQKLASYAPVEQGAAIGVYRALIERQHAAAEAAAQGGY